MVVILTVLMGKGELRVLIAIVFVSESDVPYSRSTVSLSVFNVFS